MKRAFLIILDSVGIGAAPDAARYGDAGCNTLAHTAAAAKGLTLPVLERLGLGNIPALIPGGELIQGVPPAAAPIASYGAMRERSCGKDTTTGHWEIAGLELSQGFQLFPPGPPAFPSDLTHTFESRTGRALIGNQAASGTAIIDALGPRQLETGEWIVYTSADSVFQIAAHEDVIPLPELYQACQIARELCNAYRIGRVIARPYEGQPGAFHRTSNRRDFSYPLPEPTVLDRLVSRNIAVCAVGKIEDIYDHHGLSDSYHTSNNAESQAKLMELVNTFDAGLVIANLIDFDMLYGHRRDPIGYAHALEATDRFLEAFLAQLTPDDLLILTADHGNDPTHTGTDHTREYVPLMVYQPQKSGRSLGIRDGFFDIAQSLAYGFGIPRLSRGTSFM